jgi:hypothetical protein
MLEIKTNQLKTRKKVLIDDVAFTVRRMGNIEQLDLSQYVGRLKKLEKAGETEPLSEEQNDEIESISRKMANMFTDLFDYDQAESDKATKILRQFDYQELSLIVERVFTEVEEIVDEEKSSTTE